ncbi:MAG: hypothetical protein QM804_12915 [Propionicimonas sp.]
MDIALPPLHPLIVHAAVVLLPLTALGAIVVLLSSRARERYGSLLAVVALVAVASTFAARFSGEALAGTTTGMGTLGAHMFWGLIAPWPAAALAVTLIGFLWASRGNRRALRLTLGILTALAALASLAVVVITGHLGATAVWIG